MVGGKFGTRNFHGLKIFKGTSYGPAEYLSERAKRSRLMNSEEEARYYKKAKQSKGFDVDGCTGCMPGRIAPISPTCEEWKSACIVARFAACRIGGEQPERLEFKTLDKANRQPVQGIMYYVTFTAKDTVDEEIKTYRAKVWY